LGRKGFEKIVFERRLSGLAETGRKRMKKGKMLRMNNEFTERHPISCIQVE